MRYWLPPVSRCYVMLCLAATALAIGGVIGYAQGIKHRAVLPVGLVILAIVAANGLLLRHARHQANVATNPRGISYAGRYRAMSGSA